MVRHQLRRGVWDAAGRDPVLRGACAVLGDPLRRRVYRRAVAGAATNALPGRGSLGAGDGDRVDGLTAAGRHPGHRSPAGVPGSAGKG